MSTSEDDTFDRLCRTKYEVAYKLGTEKYLELMFAVPNVDEQVDLFLKSHGWTLNDLFIEHKKGKIMAISEVSSPTRGIVGYLHTVECTTDDSVLIFQLPRATNQLSNVYIDGAKEAIKNALPPNRHALIIGADVNVYELYGVDAVILKLKGII